MNNWFGYLIIAIQWGTTIFGILYKIFAKKVNEKIQPHPLPHHGMACIGYLTSNHQSDKSNVLESYGIRWPLLYSWRWILR